MEQAMSLRRIAFWVGLFSFVMGIITYDKQVVTAPVPVITGLLVMILALAGLIPEFKRCSSCQRRIPQKWEQCRFCGARQEHEDT